MIYPEILYAALILGCVQTIHACTYKLTEINTQKRHRYEVSNNSGLTQSTCVLNTTLTHTTPNNLIDI